MIEIKKKKPLLMNYDNLGFQTILTKIKRNGYSKKNSALDLF